MSVANAPPNRPSKKENGVPGFHPETPPNRKAHGRPGVGWTLPLALLQDDRVSGAAAVGSPDSQRAEALDVPEFRHERLDRHGANGPCLKVLGRAPDQIP